MSEFSLFGEKLYLSPILDVYNGEIISYTISKRANFEQVSTMLEAALTKVQPAKGLIFHTDQGFHYQNPKFQKALAENDMTQSMSRKGNCLDNAMMESFFGHLKSELLYLSEFRNIEHFRNELIAYIDYYNHHRIRLKLKGLSPVQYRTQASIAA